MKYLQKFAGGNCFHTIIPPFIIQSIAQNGTQTQQAAAQLALIHDKQFRSQRMAALRNAKTKSRSTVQEGAVIARKNRQINTSNNSKTLPGTLVRSEGQGASGDVAVNEAYDGFGATLDLYQDVYGRNSIDDKGMDLIGSVHYENNYDNAFFNGSQMVFGDGDGVSFNRFTIAIDIMAHELTHGVTGATAGLEYHDQSGALNESISDVFGSLVKQRFLGHSAAQADWLIGAGLFTSTVNGASLRSMKAPGTAYDDPVLGKDPQSDNMANYVNTKDDDGGVHINSGIPNKAFYLAATAIGGNSWDIAGNIWYRTLLDSRLSSTAQFQDFANLTATNASTLYDANVQAAVIQAWHGVGIDVGSDVSDGWLTDRFILGLWATDEDRNAWAYVEPEGWKKIAYDSDNVFYHMLGQLSSAKASSKTVSLYVTTDNVITQLYVNT